MCKVITANRNMDCKVKLLRWPESKVLTLNLINVKLLSGQLVEKLVGMEVIA